ncbi:MAG: site-specific DNA-methyltransferase [Candidatus Parcubacteria bacterium]|nr:MAG: site-specific DNA-methyltransferase [Candidatus Parcubacteria bacterium]
MPQNYREKFYGILEGMFMGDVKDIEGQGGFINLLKIKKNYYQKVFKPKLEEKINEVLNKHPNFETELFEKFWTFFSRYFSESGSIYFVNTPSYHQIYEKIYSDKEDIVLFWKTRDLYYIKTDRIFKNLEIEIDNQKFYFDVSKLEYKKANEKRDIIYELYEKQTTEERIYFYVYYSEKGRTTKTDEILKVLKKEDIKLTEEILEKAFKRFEQQSEVDYFIHKNAKAFLTEQLKLYIYNYLFKETQNWTPERIDQINKFKETAEFIIDFVSKFEDELVKIWNKPRFVFNSNYVITLDRIIKQNKEKGIEIIKKIINHKNFQEQIKEWQELGIVDKEFDKNKIIQKDITGENLNSKYQFLPIDTKYFKDLEIEILELFDDLDDRLDGWLIKSENYQALNTILPKFKEKVQTIYIDPPFNKEQDADYLYNVKYKDSTWITLLENRISLARDLLKDTGSIFVRCDYNGNMYVRLLLNEIFGEENFRNEIQVKRITKLGFMKEESKQYTPGTDSVFWFSNTEKFKFYPQYKKLEKQRQAYWHSLESGGRSTTPIIIEGRIFYPRPNHNWKFSQDKIDEMYKEGRIRINEKATYIDIHGNKVKGMPEYLVLPSEEKGIDTVWTDIPGYSANWGFRTENSEIFLKRVIESTSNEGDLVMDFFLGSGTTTAVAHKLKRKWLGVEMGEHFYSVVLPRMKKVLAYDKSGISKEKDIKEKYNENNAGGFFKYYELEQYEDILRKAKYQDINEPKTLFDKDFNYIFMPDEKMLSALEIDYENNKVKFDLNKIYPNIDIAETLLNLKGKWIKKITKDYIEFEDGEKIDLNNLDLKSVKNLIWW